MAKLPAVYSTGFISLNVSESIARALETPYARGRAGSLFEQAVHRKFRAGIRFQPEAVTADAPPHDNNILKMDEGDGYFYNLSVRAGNGSREVNAKYLDRYMVPILKTKESVDSVWISGLFTVLFQMTVSPTHLMKLRGIIELLAQQPQLPADAKRDVRIVFILPTKDEPTKIFTCQSIECPAGLPTSKVTIAEAADKFPRYVHYHVDLGLSN